MHGKPILYEPINNQSPISVKAKFRFKFLEFHVLRSIEVCLTAALLFLLSSSDDCALGMLHDLDQMSLDWEP